MVHRVLRPRFSDARTETIWLTIYADLITNLLLLFLALYGLTMMGDEALVKAMRSMKLGDEKIVQKPYDKTDFDDITLSVKHELKNEPGISVQEGAGYVRIEFGESALFDSGKAVTKETAKPVLLKVASILKEVPFTIIVEGHTDNVPMSPGSHYRDNRELSMGRAMSLIQVLVEAGNIPSAQLAAAAYGSYKPRASNETAAGRRMNRRCEIALLKDFDFKSESETKK